MGRSASIYLGDGRRNKSDFHGYKHEFRFYLDPIHAALYSGSASTTVTLTGAAGVNYIGLDNVSLDPAGGGGSVPEPESYVLTAIGIAILAAGALSVVALKPYPRRVAVP